MNDQLLVLNALLRLARRRVPATLSEVHARVGVPSARVRVAVATLSRAGFVRRRPGSGAVAELTLEGLALAVALAKRTASRARKGKAARPAVRAA